MKTIFVTLPIGLTVRNLLFTGVLNKVISQGDVRVVAFTPVLDLADRYSETEDHLIFEPLPPRNRYRLTGLLNHILNFRFKRLIDDPSLTSLRLKRRWLREVRPKQWLFESILAQPFPKSRLIYRILSAVHDRRLGVSKEIPELFDQYKPSMMFATNPTVMFEHDFLKFAKRTGVPTVGMIHSWDDLTTEGRIVVPVDRYFVWNELMKGELIKLHGASEEQISVTGIPQFDPYADVLSPCDKEQFLIGQDLDPGKLTVLFATSAGGDTPEEPEILERLVLALNKVDLSKKHLLLPIMETWHQTNAFKVIIPISARTGDGVDALVEEIAQRMEPGPALYPDDMVTDRSMRFLASELIREKLFLQLNRELPYAVAVEVETWAEEENHTHIRAVIHIEKESQKRIAVGAGGSRVKAIGIAARQDLEQFLGRKVHLELFVHVQPRWSQTPVQLKRFGYEGEGGEGA